MDAFDEMDIGIFVTWPLRGADGVGAGAWPAASADGAEARDGGADLPAMGVGAVAARKMLELKSALHASPLDALTGMLNELTLEMRAQFELFRRLRAQAATALDDGDEAAGKLARADVKAATDAIAMIVRTLEKIDEMQRQAARDRADIEMREAENGDHEKIREGFRRLIEQRAREQAAAILAGARDGEITGGGGAGGEDGAGCSPDHAGTAGASVHDGDSGGEWCEGRGAGGRGDG